MFRNLGVRIMQITYNNRNSFGDGCLEAGNAGLSKAGIAAVKKMNEAGVAVDLSHSGYRTTSEAIAASPKPVLISHAGCAAVYAHPRNKPDEILKSLADRGGYFGVFLMPYLVASPTIPTRQHVLDHLVHAINVCGADHAGIGSDGSIERIELTLAAKADFDRDIARRKKLGIGAPGEDRYPYVPDLNGPDHMQVIAEELARRGQPSSVIEKVLVRISSACWARFGERLRHAGGMATMHNQNTFARNRTHAMMVSLLLVATSWSQAPRNHRAPCRRCRRTFPAPPTAMP